MRRLALVLIFLIALGCCGGCLHVPGQGDEQERLVVLEEDLRKRSDFKVYDPLESEQHVKFMQIQAAKGRPVIHIQSRSKAYYRELRCAFDAYDAADYRLASDYFGRAIEAMPHDPRNNRALDTCWAWIEFLRAKMEGGE